MPSSIASTIPDSLRKPISVGMRRPTLPTTSVDSYVNKQLASLDRGTGGRADAPTMNREGQRQARKSAATRTDDPFFQDVSDRGPQNDQSDIAVSINNTNRRVKMHYDAAAEAKRRAAAKAAKQRQRGMYRGPSGGGGGRSGSQVVSAPSKGMRQIAPGQYLRNDAAVNFLRMAAAARRDGVNIGVTRGWRSNALQAKLYAAYKAGYGNKAAAPGKSLHNYGIAVDVQLGSGVFNWLLRNGRRFGFSWANGSRYGEKWHWEYVG